MDTIEIKKATVSDFQFIATCIIESEKSGSDIFSYSAIFDITESDFTVVLKDIFEEDIEDQPWCYQHWSILTLNGKPASGLCSWLEGRNETSSDVLKSQLLNFMIPKLFAESMEKLKMVSEITIPRKKNTLQLEHLYTKIEYRGKGLMRKLMLNVLTDHLNYNTEIQLLQNNQAALSLYTDMGFNVNVTKCNEGILKLNLLSSACKVSLIKNHG